jgi:hypothetical protein
MDLTEIKIASRNPQQKIWLVRADSGMYFEHFRAGSIISIKHLDLFYKFETQGDQIPNAQVIEQAILRREEYRSVNSRDNSRRLNAKGRRYFNQILHFIDDIKEGDLVVSLNDDRVTVGVCASSKAYFSKDPISFMEGDAEDGEEISPLSHTLRKKVIWGPLIRRSLADGLLRAPFRCQQTISRLDDHWKEVYSLIYPFYTDGDSLFFSNFIGTTGEIGGKVISRLFSNLSDVEQLFDELLSSKITQDVIDRLFDDDLDNDQLYSLTAKAFFMSPGGVNSKIPLPAGVSRELALKGMAILFLISTGFLSVEAAAEALPTDTLRETIYSPSGMLDERNLNPKTTKNVDRLLGQLIDQNQQQITSIKKRQQSTKVKQKLRLTIPDFDTSMLESKGAIKVTRVVEDER